MAFSTQKEFFHVPFMDQTIEFECKKACVKLKSYESSIDDRSWAMDEVKQSQFLSDLVTCNMPVTDPDGPGGSGGRGIGDVIAKHGIKASDSLLDCANRGIGNLNDILSLKKQLDVSNERLKTAHEENEKIKSIMSQKFDSNHSKDFHNKIQKLSSSGKINKSEEKDLVQIYHKFEDVNKGYEVLQAENSYLKRLVEKLSKRASMESIKVEPEGCKDINYLQNQVNCLRKEVLMLRSMEDEQLKCQQAQMNNSMSDQDAEKIRGILEERNSLREKCRTFKDLEKRVRELQKKSQQADQMSGNLSTNLEQQSQCIAKMEQEMRKMQKYYEDEISRLKFQEELLKCQMQEMRDELCRANCKAQKAECLQMEIGCLRNELMKRDLALGDYDCQYKQLMFVIEELQGRSSLEIQNLRDTQTQTCDDYVDELAFFASVTLEEVMKELNKRGVSGESIPGGDSKGATDSKSMKPASEMSPEECCKEVTRLQQMVSKLETEKSKLQAQGGGGKAGPDCEALYAEALKKLKELETQNAQLQKAAGDCQAENQRLVENLKERGANLDSISTKVNKLDDEIGKQSKEAKEMGKDLDQSIQLVKEISDVQLKNQQLASAVNAINNRDDQKLIDDLRRQLKEQMERNAQLQKESEDLRTQLKNRGVDAAPAPAAGAAPAAAPGAAAAPAAAPDAAPGAGGAAAPTAGPAAAGAAAPPTAGAESTPSAQTGGDGAATKDGVAMQPGQTPDGDDKELQKLGGGVAQGAKAGQGKKGADSGRGGAKGGASDRKGKGQGEEDPKRYQEFLEKKVPSMSKNLEEGRDLECELRTILDAFQDECGYCFCKAYVSKSKFYIICHKILHNGINALSFRELAYFHKKLYMAAEKLHPGCLLKLLLAEQQCVTKDSGGRKLKCCNCKNTLCCNNSEEMLKDKVTQLEKEIEQAKEHLDNLRVFSQRTYRKSYRTYEGGGGQEETTLQLRPKAFPKCNSKQLKNLKARIMKCSELLQ